MSAVSALILVTVAAFLIHGSSAIRCYECVGGAHDSLNGCYHFQPLWMPKPKACLPIYDSCWIGEGSGITHRDGKNMKIVILAHLTQTYRHLADWRSHTQLD